MIPNPPFLLTEKALKEGKEQAGELLSAIAQAKVFTEGHDKINTPVPVLLGSLNTTFKRAIAL